jgi:hypothetical protein
MEPFEWLSDDDDGTSRVAGALRGGRLSMAAFEGRSPSEALRQVASEINVKELELMVFAGESYYLDRESPAVSRIVSIHGDSAEQFDHTRILKLVAQAAQPAALTETRVVTSYEAYYLDRHQQHPLPALSFV